MDTEDLHESNEPVTGKRRLDLFVQHVLMLHGGGEINETVEASGLESWNVDPEVWTVSGERLNPSAVKQAKEEELRRFEIMRVYSPVLRSQMESYPDGIKVDAKWVVTQKGTPAAPIIKARLVAREICGWREEGRSFCRNAWATCTEIRGLPGCHWSPCFKSGHHGPRHQVRFLVWRSQEGDLFGASQEDRNEGYPDFVGKLHKALYGSRDAPQ